MQVPLRVRPDVSISVPQVAGPQVQYLPQPVPGPQYLVPMEQNGNGEITMTPEQWQRFTRFYFLTHYKPKRRVFAFMPQQYRPVRIDSPRQELWRQYWAEKMRQGRAEQLPAGY